MNANWSFGAPGAGRTAVFDLAEAYSVAFAGNATSAYLHVQAGDVTLDLNGSTYTLAPIPIGTGGESNAVIVSSSTGPAPMLRITDGQVVTDFGTAIGILDSDNPGAVTIGAGAMWTENSGFFVNMNSQLTVEAGGALIVAGASGGNLGAAAGSTIALKDATIDAGTATFNDTATLRIGIGGTDMGEFGLLSIAGQATLRGTFAVDLLDGFMPTLGDTFEIMTFGTRDGDFATYTDLDVGGHLALAHSFTATSLILRAMPAIAGDINLDGAVDIFDVNEVSAHWDTAGPQGDVNGDGIVDIFDVNAISANWGATESGSAQAVPEPASIALLCLGGLAMLAVRSHRKHIVAPHPRPHVFQ